MNKLHVPRVMRIMAIIGMVMSMTMPFGSLLTSAQTAKTTVYPGGVVIQPGVCVDGVATAPIVTVPSDTTTDGIYYEITQPDAAGNFRVTAQSGDSFRFGDVSGTPWQVKNEWNLFYEGTAQFPDCSKTPNSAPTAQGDVPNMGVFALPLDCGSAPYPDPTGANVTSDIQFGSFVLTQNGVAHTSGPIYLSAADETLTLQFEWYAPGSVTAGEYFVFDGPLDGDGNKVFTSATQWFPVWNYANTAQAGCASVVGGDIIVQFTSYVNGRTGVGGRINLDLELANGSTSTEKTLDFTFDDDSNFQITIPGVPTGAFGKRGWFNRDDQGVVVPQTSIGWTIHVPASANGYTNLVLTDNAADDSGWTFSCAGPAATKTTYVAVGPFGPATLDLNENCSAKAMTLSVSSVPKNTTVDFYFTADITPGAEGPFYNVASAQSNEVTIDELPYSVKRTIGSGVADGDFAVTPIPPAIDNATCVDDENDTWVPAKVTLPEQEGVIYTMVPNPFPETGGYLVVYAELEDGYVWASGAEGNGWVLDEETNTMVFETNVSNDPCTPPTPTPTPPVSTPTPPVNTPTPELPCVTPPPEECIPTPTPEGTPPGGGDETPSPTPCVPPTLPPWCQVTPTPPTVHELPKTGTQGGSSMGSLIAAGALTSMIVVAAGLTIRRERSN